MDFYEVVIYTNHNGVEIVTSMLEDMDITSFAVEDKKEFEDFLKDNKDSWNLLEDGLLDYKEDANVKVYIEKDENAQNQIDEIKKNLKTIDNQNMIYGSLNTEIKIIKNEDWENSWKDYFHTFKLGESMVIKPLWEEYEEDKDDKIIIEIDPGLSFGTGTHETTKLCLIMLEKYIKGGGRVTDVGCGSGILSVAALKHGASEVSAVDIDPLAVDVTKHFMKINGIEKGYEVFCGDLTDKINKKADIMVANIFAHIIVRLVPSAVKLLNAGGIFITSGIIEDGLESVKDVMEESGFKIINEKKMGDWYSVVGEKI